MVGGFAVVAPKRVDAGLPRATFFFPISLLPICQCTNRRAGLVTGPFSVWYFQTTTFRSNRKKINSDQSVEKKLRRLSLTSRLWTSGLVLGKNEDVPNLQLKTLETKTNLSLYGSFLWYLSCVLNITIPFSQQLVDLTEWQAATFSECFKASEDQISTPPALHAFISRLHPPFPTEQTARKD